MTAPSLPRSAAAMLVAGTIVVGALAALQPKLGLGLVLVAALVVGLVRMPLPRLGRLAVMVAAVTAILGPNLALPQAPQAFAFRVVIVLLAAGLAVYVLVDGHLAVPNGIVRPAGLLVALGLWTFASIGWAENLPAALRWTLFLAMMGGLAVAIPLACRRREVAVRLMVVLAVTFAFSTLTAVAQLRFGVTLATTTQLTSGDSEFASSLFGNQNNFATYLTLTLPFFLCLPVVFRELRLIVLGVVGALITLGALMFTGSRSNLIAAVLVIGGLGAWSLVARRAGGRKVAIAIALLAVLLVIPSVAGRGVLPIPQTAIEKFDLRVLLAQQRALSGSGAVRTAVLQEGFGLVGDTMGRGVGAGNAETSLQSLDAFTGVENLHNWWMELLVDLGVPGLMLFVAFYLALLRGQFRAARRAADPFVRWLGLSCGLALVGFIAGSLGPSSVIHFAPMWITFGLGMLTMALHHRAPTP